MDPITLLEAQVRRRTAEMAVRIPSLATHPHPPLSSPHTSHVFLTPAGATAQRMHEENRLAVLMIEAAKVKAQAVRLWAFLRCLGGGAFCADWYTACLWSAGERKRPDHDVPQGAGRQGGGVRPGSPPDARVHVKTRGPLI